jgi:hypothetical protein
MAKTLCHALFTARTAKALYRASKAAQGKKKRDDGVANTDGRSPTLLCASLYDARQIF